MGCQYYGGTFKGRKCFDVNSNRCAFIHRHQVIEKLGDTEAIGKDVAQPKSYSGDLRQVKFVKTKYYGICKVILIRFGSLSDGEIIELKLRHWLPNRDDGTVDCKGYFSIVIRTFVREKTLEESRTNRRHVAPTKIAMLMAR
ncbi:hypothetical protein RFI_36137 [Reticulomyxa filosa]|uniref:Uncharacterized protein n=1 Tax=Reticulomyxa filosa TaxID=46433 RepID=X6LH53_RETFI|nr:hypothetical protein RFI_36137 [Reticulomyxa filosa]|eukprot:ETO01303.1 hypothetical protein RFI_36137 [Reticulomyxa filosa]